LLIVEIEMYGAGSVHMSLCLSDCEAHSPFKDEMQVENIKGISQDCSHSGVGEFAILLGGYALSTSRQVRTFQRNMLLEICRECQSNKSGLHVSY